MYKNNYTDKKSGEVKIEDKYIILGQMQRLKIQKDNNKFILFFNKNNIDKIKKIQ